MPNYDKFSICDKCHDVIILRRPGSSVWKLTTSKIYTDKISHKPINGIQFDNGWDARVIKKAALKIYWEHWEDKDRPDYFVAWREAVTIALNDAGFVDAK